MSFDDEEESQQRSGLSARSRELKVGFPEGSSGAAMSTIQAQMDLMSQERARFSLAVCGCLALSYKPRSRASIV